MTRLILAIVAALFASLAQAAPECLPGLYGPQFPGSKLVPMVRGHAGWYAYGWCQAADGSPYAVYLVCAHGECASDLGTQAGRTLTTLGLQLIASDPVAVYGGWWDATARQYDCGPNGPHSTAPGTPRAAACAELLALLDRDKPAWSATPRPSYVVKHNPSYTGTPNTRPVYPFAAGARGAATMPVVRAIAGQPCDPNKSAAPAAGSADLYAAYGPDFAADRVTLCTKQ